ncbi:hypothetical protein DPEC_G00195110, partial [Dallia pectoralis]
MHILKPGSSTCLHRMAGVCAVVAIYLALLSPCPSLSAPQGNPEPGRQPYDLEDFDLNGETDWENLDLNGENYAENYDYDDLDQEIEVGTVASSTTETWPTANIPPHEEEEEEEEEEEVTLPPKPTPRPVTVTLDFKGPGLFGPETGL